MSYEIEKDIPIPRGTGRGPQSKYPWDLMEVGDSLKAKDPDDFRAMRSAAFSYAQRNGWAFTTNAQELRIWRTK